VKTTEAASNVFTALGAEFNGGKNKKLSCRKEVARCFVFVCSQLQHTYKRSFYAASDLLVHKLLLNSVLLFPHVSGGVRPNPRTNTPRC